MINDWLRPARNVYNNPLLLLRKRYIQALALVSAVLLTASMGIALVLTQGNVPTGLLLITLVVIGSDLVALLLVQFNYITLSGVVFLAGSSLGLFGLSGPLVLIPLSIGVIISAAVLLNIWLFVVFNALIVIRLVIEGLAISTLAETAQLLATWELAVTSITLLFVSLTVRLVVSFTERAARRATRSVEVLQATAEIGQALAKVLARDQLLSRAVDLIRDRFAFYHVQVFLVDEDRKYASLVASTGEVGQRLIARGHRLAVGSQSVIGRVTQMGEPVISRDTDTDHVHAVNELLPNTRSELALPITDGERIIGALDVQSTRRNAFSDTDVQAFQILANQLATNIRNASLFEEKEASVQENKRLFLETEISLREIQHLNTQLTGTSWADYLREQVNVGAITFEGSTETFEAEWSDLMREAQRRKSPASRSDGDQRRVAVPILLRSAVIGAIEIETTEADENEIIEMTNVVAQRLATNLDNVRLYEETQESARQEQRINSVVSRYQSASSVDELLQITLAELTDALGAEHGTIRLGVAETLRPAIRPPHTGNGSNPHD